MMNKRKVWCKCCRKVHIGNNVDNGLRLFGMVVPEFKPNKNCKNLMHGNRGMFVCPGCYEKLKDTEWWEDM